MTKLNPALQQECDDFMAEQARQELNNVVNNECALYLNTGDARFLWRAFLTLHEAGQPIPQNFLDKFAEWGNKVLAAGNPREIATALELSGDEKRRVGPKHSSAYQRNWHLASEVKIVQDLYKITLAEAIRTVARNRKMRLEDVKAIYHKVFTAPLNKVRKATKKTQASSLASAMGTWR